MDTSSRIHCHCLKGQKLFFFFQLSLRRGNCYRAYDTLRKAAIAHETALPCNYTGFREVVWANRKPSLRKEWELQGPVKEPSHPAAREGAAGRGELPGLPPSLRGAVLWGWMFCSNVWWGITSTKGNIRLNRSGRFRWHFVCSFSYVRVSVFDKSILGSGTVTRSDWKVGREWNSIESGAGGVGAFSPHSYL